MFKVVPGCLATVTCSYMDILSIEEHNVPLREVLLGGFRLVSSPYRGHPLSLTVSQAVSFPFFLSSLFSHNSITHWELNTCQQITSIAPSQLIFTTAPWSVHFIVSTWRSRIQLSVATAREHVPVTPLFRSLISLHRLYCCSFCPLPTQPQFFPLFALFSGWSVLLCLGLDPLRTALISSTGPISLCLIHVRVFLRYWNFLEKRVHDIFLIV